MDNMDTAIATPSNISEKKKRGRKKNVIVQNSHQDQDQDQDQEQSQVSQNIVVNENKKEKKERKKRTKKGDNINNSNNSNNNNAIMEAVTESSNEPEIKKRKRRTRKDIEDAQNADKNIILSSENQNHSNHSNNNNTNTQNESSDEGTDCKTNIQDENNSNNNINEPEQKEEKVAKKRGRKPKGGKITIQPQTNSNIQNELPNIILHLKCSLSDLNKNNVEMTETIDTKINSNSILNNNNNISSIQNINSNAAMESIQSYNSINTIGSEINSIISDNVTSSGHNLCLSNRDLLKKNHPLSNVHNMITKDENNVNDKLSETYSSAMFPVYDPCIPSDPERQHSQSHTFPPPIPGNMPYYDGMNQIINKNPTSLFSTIYSPDIISYNNQPNHDDEYSSNPANLNERDIWKKINQLKLSFHKSDICQNIRGAQRSACFWCTCEFDSPAIYIPKSVLKDMYNVYGCFCSPECGAAFLMNESIDTSTKFERYHLLNSLYGKIYKYEKSIKIAPNPYYLLNKFYGTLTIQEYRKLFQSDQMIYVVNKPLTHILPELYEDNNDFLLNNKIIPTNSVNLKKKVLKSNV